MNEQPYQIHTENGSKKIKDVLYNQVAFVLAIGGFVWGAFNYLNAPQVQFNERLGKIETNMALIQQSVQTIQLNHEQHMQDALTEIADNKKLIADLQKEQVDQGKEIVRLLTIMQKK
jgi:hypothetical protein